MTSLVELRLWVWMEGHRCGESVAVAKHRDLLLKQLGFDAFGQMAKGTAGKQPGISVVQRLYDVGSNDSGRALRDAVTAFINIGSRRETVKAVGNAGIVCRQCAVRQQPGGDRADANAGGTKRFSSRLWSLS